MNINMPDYLEMAVKEFDVSQMALDRAETTTSQGTMNAALRVAESRERTAIVLGILSIAQDLRRLVERLDGFSDNLAEDALRVNVLR